MRVLNNEKGAALIIVLLTIVIVSIMAVPLVHASLSSAVQVNKTEQDLKAKELRDMGTKYFRQKLISEVEASDKDALLANLNILPSEFSLTVPSQMGDNLNIKIEVDSIDSEDDHIDLTYTSQGSYENSLDESTETVRLIHIGGTRTGGVHDLLRDYLNGPESQGYIVNPKITGGGNEPEILSEDIYFDGDLKRSSNNNLTIEGNAIVENEIRTSNHRSIHIFGYFFHLGGGEIYSSPNTPLDGLVVEKDMLISKFNLDQSSNNHQASVCVKGSIYKYDEDTGEPPYKVDGKEEYGKYLNKVDNCAESKEGKINYVGGDFTSAESSDSSEGSWSIHSVSAVNE